MNKILLSITLLFYLLVSNVFAAEPGITSSDKVDKKNFKIITYNVWVGYHDGDHPRFPCYHSGMQRREGICKWLKEQDPDVVVFQELMDYSADKLRQESAMWGHRYAVTLRDKGMAIGISSKYPVDLKEILTEGMHHGLIYCNIGGIDIIGTHLWPSFDNTILNEAIIVGERIKNSLENKTPVIVLGDFNAFSPEDDLFIDDETIAMYNKWNWKLENGRPSYRVVQYLLDLGLKDVCTKFEKNNGARNMRYDYILTSPDLMENCTDATHIQDIDFLKLSDHFPVVAEFGR